MDLENTYWNGKGKYEGAAAKINEMIPAHGKAEDPKVEAARVAFNAYYDFFNNGGGNRMRLAELKPLTLKRGTEASKALSKIKTYAPKGDKVNFFGRMLPVHLAPLYELMIDGVIETYFPELIEEPK